MRFFSLFLSSEWKNFQIICNTKPITYFPISWKQHLIRKSDSKRRTSQYCLFFRLLATNSVASPRNTMRDRYAPFRIGCNLFEQWRTQREIRKATALADVDDESLENLFENWIPDFYGGSTSWVIVGDGASCCVHHTFGNRYDWVFVAVFRTAVSLPFDFRGIEASDVARVSEAKGERKSEEKNGGMHCAEIRLKNWKLINGLFWKRLENVVCVFGFWYRRGRDCDFI